MTHKTAVEQWDNALHVLRAQKLLMTDSAQFWCRAEICVWSDLQSSCFEKAEPEWSLQLCNDSTWGNQKEEHAPVCFFFFGCCVGTVLWGCFKQFVFEKRKISYRNIGWLSPVSRKVSSHTGKCCKSIRRLPHFWLGFQKMAPSNFYSFPFVCDSVKRNEGLTLLKQKEVGFCGVIILPVIDM